MEILYSILHMIGCDAERAEQNAMVEHLRDAFHLTQDKHTKLLDIASMREVLERLNSIELRHRAGSYLDIQKWLQI